MKTQLLVLCSAFLSSLSCSIPGGVFEKNIAIPGQEWQGSFRPEIIATISDTAALYNVYFVIRHTDAYSYNNIWIRATVQEPGETRSRSQEYELTLANNERGWIGSAMDDIYESRILLQPRTRFTQPGTYHFTLEQIMREDPLKHVLNVGIRIEKVIPNDQVGP